MRWNHPSSLFWESNAAYHGGWSSRMGVTMCFKMCQVWEDETGVIMAVDTWDLGFLCRKWVGHRLLDLFLSLGFRKSYSFAAQNHKSVLSQVLGLKFWSKGDITGNNYGNSRIFPNPNLYSVIFERCRTFSSGWRNDDWGPHDDSVNLLDSQALAWKGHAPRQSSLPFRCLAKQEEHTV